MDGQRSNAELPHMVGTQAQVLGMKAPAATTAQETAVPIQQKLMKSASKQRLHKNASEASLSSMSKMPFGMAATSMGMFPRAGEQIQPLSGARPPPLPDTLEEIWKSVESVKREVTQTVEAQERKLDGIVDSMSQLSDALGKQREAALSVEQQQHGELVEKLARVESHLEQNIKKDMDDLALRLLDLPKSLNRQLTSLSEEVQRQHREGEAQRKELMKYMEAVQNNTLTGVAESMARIAQDIQESQDVEEQFRLIMGQLTQVSQSLNLDYFKMEGSMGKRAAKNAKHKSNPEFSEMKAVRDYGSQAEILNGNMSTQTEAALMKSKKTNMFPRSKTEVAKPVKLKAEDDIKAKAMQALIKPQYNVFDMYHTSGCAQHIAKARWFDYLTVSVVAMNAVWIAVEIDLNKALVLNEADSVFQIAENAFCSFFFVEVVIRFLAFAHKLQAFQDMWFVFDACLVLLMAVETWFVPLFLYVFKVQDPGKTLGNLTMLRSIRLVKLLRLSRISKLLRAVPELVIIIKAMYFASRSVLVFCGFWLVLIYFFAIVLRQISDGSEAGSKYFSSVPESMNTLLLRGILADFADTVYDVSDPDRGNALFGVVMIFFVVIASITVMYMLVGVLVEAVSQIAIQEKENLTVSYIAAKVREKLESQGQGEEQIFSKATLQALLIDHEMAQLLISVDIDIVALVDTLDIVYEDMEKAGSDMTFVKVIDLLLNGRGKNSATVRDTKDVLRIVKSVVKSSAEDMLQNVQSEFATIREGLSQIRAEVLELEDQVDHAWEEGHEHRKSRFSE